jgi:DegV family protein with EDD domain
MGSGVDGAARPVAVVTDSTAYLPREIVESLGIEVVSLYWDLGDGPARETDYGDDYREFYVALEAAATVATTSPPTVEDFLGAFEPLLGAGKDVVSIHISSGMSETCAHAEVAARQLAAAGNGGERVVVVDSAGAGGQLGLVAIAAARAARRGLDRDGVAALAREARQEATAWFLLDTLEYLRRGGRVGGAIAWVGSTLNIKPILEVATEFRAVERVRTHERGLERLVDFARRQAALGADVWFVQHTRAKDDAIKLADRVRPLFTRPPEFISECGPVVGTHTGPGVAAIGAIPGRFLEYGTTSGASSKAPLSSTSET